MEKLFTLILIISPISAHICLISPQQRGPIDISTAGSRTCFKHGFPCGGDAPVNPKFILTAGQPTFIKWQQNYNHYEPGYPGYMDIGYGPINSKSEDDWTTLGVVTDRYVFSQDYQHNYTAIVTIPNKPCPHCVIRVRYNPHKPGETTFYQCSDVRVTTSGNKSHTLLQSPLTDTKDRSLYRAVKLTHRQPEPQVTPIQATTGLIYGTAYDPFNTSRISYEQIHPVSGIKRTLEKWNFGLAVHNNVNDDAYAYVTDEVLVVEPARNSSIMMFHRGSRDQVPGGYIEVDLRSGSIVDRKTIQPTITSAINAVIYYRTGSYLTFAIEEDSSNPGNYYFNVGLLGLLGNRIELGKTPMTENLFINFQWMVFDKQNNILYALLGNENAADTLDARIYSFSISPTSAVFKEFISLTVSTYTFMSMHFYQATGKLLAISPGLFSATYPGYTLVEIMLPSGHIKEVLPITPPGIFEKYYGGNIINGLDQTTGILKHVLRVADSEADVIASIDLQKLSVEFSQLTNLRHIHNLVYVPPIHSL